MVKGKVDRLEVYAQLLGGEDNPVVKKCKNIALYCPDEMPAVIRVLETECRKKGIDLTNCPVFCFEPIPDVDDPIVIGQTFLNGAAYKEFKMPLKAFFLPSLILGPTGCGKSNLIKNLVSQFELYEDKCRFWIIDYLKEYRRLLASHKDILVMRSSELKLNVLRPPAGVEPSEWAQVFAEIYGHSFKVLTASKSLIHLTLSDLMAIYSNGHGGAYPTLVDYLEYLKSLKMDRILWNYLPLNLIRITSICKSLVTMIDVNRGLLDQLFDDNVIFELDDIGEGELQNFVTEFLMCYAFYARRNSAEQSKQLIIVADEASRIYDRSKEHTAGGLPTIDMLTQQMRHAQLSVICSAQEITKLTNSIISNSSTKFIFKQGSGKDEYEISTALQLSIEEKEYLSKLSVGEVIVSNGDSLYLVKTMPFILEGQILDDQVAKMAGPKIRILMEQVEQKSDLLKTKLYEMRGSASDFEKEILLHLAQNPLATAGDIANATSSSRAKAGRGLDSLIFKGLLRKVKPLNFLKGGGKVLFELADKAKALFKEWGVKYSRPGKCGLEGFYYITEYIEPYYSSRGYETKVEARSGNSTADLLVRKEGLCIVVELELTDSNLYSNLRRNLCAPGTDRIVIVLKDSPLKKKIAKELAKLNEPELNKIHLKILSDFAPANKFNSTDEKENEKE